MTGLVLLTALALDALLGEPRRWHPLVGFGALVSGLEPRLRQRVTTPRQAQLAGLAGWLLLALLPTLLLWGLLTLLPRQLQIAMDIGVLYLAIGNRSLAQHARAVAAPLLAGHLPAARRAVAMIVSRDTAELDSDGVARATVESVLENGSDAVLSSLFWFVVAGAPGVLLQRLANTLDARWGYLSPHYRDFGRAAALLDDVLNWLPARLCALGYGLTGHLPSALRCWRRQAPQLASPNAGPVMAAGAGALHLELGGSARYRGRVEVRPLFGSGRSPQAADIDRAVHLLWRTIALWLAIIMAVELAAWLAPPSNLLTTAAVAATCQRSLPHPMPPPTLSPMSLPATVPPAPRDDFLTLSVAQPCS